LKITVVIAHESAMMATFNIFDKVLKVKREVFSERKDLFFCFFKVLRSIFLFDMV